MFFHAVNYGTIHLLNSLAFNCSRYMAFSFFVFFLFFFLFLFIYLFNHNAVFEKERRDTSALYVKCANNSEKIRGFPLAFVIDLENVSNKLNDERKKFIYTAILFPNQTRNNDDIRTTENSPGYKRQSKGNERIKKNIPVITLATFVVRGTGDSRYQHHHTRGPVYAWPGAGTTR